MAEIPAPPTGRDSTAAAHTSATPTGPPCRAARSATSTAIRAARLPNIAHPRGSQGCPDGAAGAPDPGFDRGTAVVRPLDHHWVTTLGRRVPPGAGGGADTERRRGRRLRPPGSGVVCPQHRRVPGARRRNPWSGTVRTVTGARATTSFDGGAPAVRPMFARRLLGHCGGAHERGTGAADEGEESE